MPLSTALEAEIVGNRLLFVLARLPPRNYDEPSNLVHDPAPERATPLRERVEHALGDVDDALHERLRRGGLLRADLSEDYM